MRSLVIWGAIALAVAVVFAPPTAQSFDGRTITYNRDGDIRRVLRPTPSGFAIYNGRGKLWRVVRRTPSGFYAVDRDGDIVNAVRGPSPAFLLAAVDRLDGSIRAIVPSLDLGSPGVVGNGGLSAGAGMFVGGVQFMDAGAGFR